MKTNKTAQNTKTGGELNGDKNNRVRSRNQPYSQTEIMGKVYFALQTNSEYLGLRGKKKKRSMNEIHTKYMRKIARRDN